MLRMKKKVKSHEEERAKFAEAVDISDIDAYQPKFPELRTFKGIFYS